MVAIETLEGLIDRSLWFHYDVSGDVLYLRLASKRDVDTLVEETDDGFILLRDARTSDPVGLTIVNWWKRFGKGNLPDSLSEIQHQIEPWARRREVDLSMHNHIVLRTSLMLAGSFAIGYNAATAIHELGHALATWLTGGSILRIDIHPFSWSYTWYAQEPRFPYIATWAGSGFGTTAGLFSFLVGWRSRSPWLSPLVLTGVCAMIVNGLYLCVDAFLMGGGDATELTNLGTPKWFVVTLGGLIFAAGSICGLLSIQRLGISCDSMFAVRFATLVAGIGTYLVAMLIYQVLYNPGQIRLWSAYVTSGFVILALLAWLSRLMVRRWEWIRHQPVTVPDWRSSIVVLLTGVAVVAALLAYDAWSTGAHQPSGG